MNPKAKHHIDRALNLLERLRVGFYSTYAPMTPEQIGLKVEHELRLAQAAKGA